MKKVNIAIFVSGGGTNCENIIRYFKGSEKVCTALVISNKPDAPALEKAQRLDVPTQVVTKAELNDETVMMPLLRRYDIATIADGRHPMYRHASLCIASSLYCFMNMMAPHALATIFRQQRRMDIDNATREGLYQKIGNKRQEA